MTILLCLESLWMTFIDDSKQKEPRSMIERGSFFVLLKRLVHRNRSGLS